MASDEEESASLDADELLRLIQARGRFVPDKIVGSGGMANVFLVRDANLGAKRAFKIIKTALMSDAGAVARFLNEALTMASIEHPNIVHVYDRGSFEDDAGNVLFHYIVLEWCGGGSLDDHIARTRGMPPQQAIETILRICDGLRCAHAQGIFHRDIKPDNILLTEAGIPKLTDFGIARNEVRIGDLRTKTSMGMGSLGYMPPEQYGNAAKVNAASDIHALAMTLWHMISGERPHMDPSTWHQDFQQDDTLMQRIPPALVPVLRLATRMKNEERYQTLDLFMSALVGVCKELWPDSTSAQLITTSSQPVVRPVSQTAQTDSFVKIGTLHESTGQMTGVPRERENTSSARTFKQIGAALGGLSLVALISFMIAPMLDHKQQDSAIVSVAAEGPIETSPAVEMKNRDVDTATMVVLRPQDASVPAPVAQQRDATVSKLDASTIEPKRPRAVTRFDRSRKRTATKDASNILSGMTTPPITPAPEVEPVAVQKVNVFTRTPDGDHVKVWLMSSGGKYLLPSMVAPGTYKVIAQFDEREEVMTVIPRLDVGATPITLKCDSAFARCVR